MNLLLEGKTSYPLDLDDLFFLNNIPPYLLNHYTLIIDYSVTILFVYLSRTLSALIRK